MEKPSSNRARIQRMMFCFWIPGKARIATANKTPTSASLGTKLLIEIIRARQERQHHDTKLQLSHLPRCSRKTDRSAVSIDKARFLTYTSGQYVCLFEYELTARACFSKGP